MKKILVIAPHADDEILGCGGYLLHQKQIGADIHIVIGALGGEDKRQDFELRKREFFEVCKRLGVTGHYLYKGMDAKLDTVASFDLISRVDRYIDDFKPNEIFFNYKSRHQDHIKMYDCTLASIRLREGYMPNFIALYEYPFITDGLDSVKGGKMYHDISDNIEEKIELLNIYKSQIRQSPSPINGGGVKKLAALRGIEIGCEYAEMFYLQKMKI